MARMDVFEKLEILAFEKRNCAIVFLKDGCRTTVYGIVDGIYDRESQQVLKMQSGLEILLETLIQVDEITADSFC